MITLCIRYKIDIHKLLDFEDYAKAWPAPIDFPSHTSGCILAEDRSFLQRAVTAA
jgi:hypothetical protein